MLAIAQHLGKAGHQVTFYTSENFVQKVKSAGVDFVPFPEKADFDYRRPLAPEEASGLTGHEYTMRILKKMFAEGLSDLQLGIQGMIHERQIDLIIVDTGFFGLFPMLLGPEQKRPPVLGCGVNPLILSI